MDREFVLIILSTFLWGLEAIGGQLPRNSPPPKPVVALTADVVACRRDHLDEPADYLVADCKDWQSRPLDEAVIIRLCLLAFLSRAMPVLWHTTRLHLRERVRGARIERDELPGRDVEDVRDVLLVAIGDEEDGRQGQGYAAGRRIRATTGGHVEASGDEPSDRTTGDTYVRP